MPVYIVSSAEEEAHWALHLRGRCWHSKEEWLAPPGFHEVGFYLGLSFGTVACGPLQRGGAGIPGRLASPMMGEALWATPVGAVCSPSKEEGGRTQVSCLRNGYVSC